MGNVPSETDIKRAIDKSGYVLELRLAPKLERAGFWVRAEQQFQDQDTGKSREIDLYATKKFDIAEQNRKFGKITYVLRDLFTTHLVIECKSTSTPLVFFSRGNTLPSYGRLLFGGFPGLMWALDKSSQEVVGELYDDHLEFIRYHSYWSATHLATRFGKLSSKKAPGGNLEWELDHSGIYGAVEKLCKATLSIHTNALQNSRELEPEHSNQFNLHMTYPILVIAGELYECRVSERGYSLKPAKKIYLDWELDSEKLKGSARICVVTESHFSTLVKTIQNDCVEIEAALKRCLKKIRVATTYEKRDPSLGRPHLD